MPLDTHQHFWRYDAAQHVWMTDAMGVLRRDCLPADLEPLLGAAGFPVEARDGVLGRNGARFYGLDHTRERA